ncbi:MAG TPA: hypothetical protein VFK02_18675 [Kofleriaceae bacterium]|nr:hypothetical protein [Kofleriaceae bacterium]
MLPRLVAIAVLAAPVAAWASPDELVGRPLVLDRGGVVAGLTIELGAPAGQFAAPLSIAPDVWLGATSRLTIGVIHSSAAVDEIDAHASLCFRGDDLTCGHAYRGSGLDVRWSWLDGPLAVAPRVRLLARDVDPWKPAATLGALARWTAGAIAITSDPYLRLGLANQDLGNRAALFVPIWLAVQPAARWMIALHTGWDSELATVRDGWHVPVGLEGTLRVTARLEVGLAAGFPHLLGPQNSVKQRALSVTLEYRP